MDPKNPHLTEWKRLLLGTAPWSFLLEVVARVVVVYAFLLVLARLWGKRMSGQVSNLELGVVLLLGAIVAPAFEVPGSGLIPAAVLLLGLLALHRGVTWLGARFPKAERVTQGRPTMLLAEGRLQPRELEHVGLSNEQLFAALRAQSIRHLGELQRIYFEGYGDFSLLRASTPKPGLSVLPAQDADLQHGLPRAKGWLACVRCGHVLRTESPPSRCEWCGATGFTEAVES
jgi:uncharacterized membrane protein YcaP (DUF421 family)